MELFSNTIAISGNALHQTSIIILPRNVIFLQGLNTDARILMQTIGK